MTIKWTESATVKLVVLYGRYECLRNPFHPDFNKQLCCYRAYKQIVNSMNIPGLTVCDCVKRISFVKKQYCFELSKISIAISRGHFYKPKASWFEMMHELLFPYIQSGADFNEDIRKDCDCVLDEEGNGDKCDIEEEAIECDCPPCECPPPNDLERVLEPEIEAYDTKSCSESPPKKHHRSKSRAPKSRGSSKSPARYVPCRDSASDLKRPKTSSKPHGSGIDHGINPRKTTCDRGNDVIRSQSSKQCFDVGNRTNSTCLNQAGAQTERKSVMNTHTSCERAERVQCAMSDETSAGDVCIDSVEDGDKKYKHYDEFEMFGKSIASQLRSLNLGNECDCSVPKGEDRIYIVGMLVSSFNSIECAVNLEKRIQDMMTEERLSCMRESGATAMNYGKEFSCDCEESKECCNSDKNEICACGLPVSKCLPLFPIRNSQCYGFDCN